LTPFEIKHYPQYLIFRYHFKSKPYHFDSKRYRFKPSRNQLELATIHSRPPTIHSVLQTFVFRPFRYRSVADRCVEVTDTTFFAPIRWGSGAAIPGRTHPSAWTWNPTRSRHSACII